MTARHAASSVSVAAALRTTPALLTSTSRRPCRSTTVSKARSIERASVTSSCTASAPISSPQRCAPSISMSARTTTPPASLRPAAIARPMPRAPPVTTQTLPSRRKRPMVAPALLEFDALAMSEHHDVRRSVGMTDDHFIGNADEQSVFDDAGNRVEARCERMRVTDRLEMTVEDPVAAVGHETLAVFHPCRDLQVAVISRIGQQLAQQTLGALPAERNHLDGQREAPETLENLLVVHYRNHFLRRGRHDLFPQQARSAALDHASLMIDLVGAVDRHIEPVHCAKIRERHAELECEFTRCIGRRHAGDLETLPDALRQSANKPVGRRTRSQSDLHAGLQVMIHRLDAGCQLRLVLFGLRRHACIARFDMCCHSLLHVSRYSSRKCSVHKLVG